jgi:serine/threonine-protein kinase
MTSAQKPSSPNESRYATLFKLASGGMASVWIGTVRGGMGFRQLVAIKKPHPHLLDEADYRAELLAEAALASSIHHANVVDVRDVEVRGDDVSLVMDYIEGASLAELLTRTQQGGPKLTPAVAVRICLDALAGLQAAHELTDDRGKPVGLIHRDISPQNILVGVDGLARVVDFGVAKFRKKDHSTTAGQLKGKIAYMAPEYLRNEAIDARLDVFAMGVVLWESLTAQRLFRGSHDVDTMQKVLQLEAQPVSRFSAEARGLEPVLEGALAKDLDRRFQSASAMAAALESAARSAGLVASARDVAELVKASFGPDLAARRAKVRERLANEPSVASLFEGAKAVAVDLGALAPPASLSPDTEKLGPAPTAGVPFTTLRDEGPPSGAVRASLEPNTLPLAHAASVAPQASASSQAPVSTPALVQAPTPSAPDLSRSGISASSDALSLSSYDAAHIPRPGSGRLLVAVAALLAVLVAVAVLVLVLVLRRGSGAAADTNASASASSPAKLVAPSASAPLVASSASVSVASSAGPSASGAPTASSTPSTKASAPKPPAAVPRSTGKKGDAPPPNPYAH